MLGMKKCFQQFRSILIGLFLLSFFTILFTSQTASAFQRKVLIEDFTNTGCGPCGYWTPFFFQALEDNDYDEDDFVLMSIHVNWPANNDPWYLNNSDENHDRWSYYGVNGVPRFIADGTTIDLRNPPEDFMQDVADFMDDRVQVNSPVSIDIHVGIEEDTYITSIGVTAEEDLEDIELYVSALEVLYEMAANSGNEHHMAMLDMVTEAGGYAFSIEVNETKSFTFESPRDIGWHWVDIENTAMIAWIQDFGGDILQSNRHYVGTQPFLNFTEITMAEAGENNDDGRPEPGEDIAFSFVLANGLYNPDAENVEVTISTDNDALEIVNGTVQIDEIWGGESGNNGDSPLTIHVPDDFQTDEVTVYFNVTSDPGEFSSTFSQKFMVGWPQVLVIHASGYDEADEIIDVWNEGDYPIADYWDKEMDGEIVAGTLDNYDLIILHSFNNDVILDDVELQAFTSFLDNGGNMVISSWGVCMNNGDSELIANYFAAEIVETNNRGRYVNAYDADQHFSGSRLFLGAGSGAGFTDNAPIIAPYEGAEAIFYYSNDNQDVGAAAVKHETRGYNTLLFSFPLESAGGIQGTEDTADLMARIWAWHLDRLEDVPVDNNSPVEFDLGSAYPNPFNSEFVVPFSLANAGNVSLKLFDLEGRLVADLASEIMPAGQHRIAVDALKYNLSVGLYMLELSQGNNTATSKVLYLK